MPTTALRRIFIGKETTRGTGVAATKQLLGRLRATPTLALYMPEDEERNSLALLHRREKMGQRVALVYDGSVTFEQIINFLSMGVKGAITPTIPTGGTTARDWTYLPSLTSGNTPDSFTFEWGDDIQEYESTFVMVEQLEFTVAMEEVWTLSANLFGRFPTQSVFTGSISAPTVEDVVANQSKIFIDGTWAGLGTTQQASLLLNATLRVPSGYQITKYADGSLDFSSFAEGKRAAEVELLYLHSSIGNTEYDNYESGGLRFIQLKTEGTVIEGTLKKTLTIDLAVRYTEPPEMFEDVNGETAIRLRGRTFQDPTSGNDFRFIVRNNLASL